MVSTGHGLPGPVLRERQRRLRQSANPRRVVRGLRIILVSPICRWSRHCVPGNMNNVRRNGQVLVKSLQRLCNTGPRCRTECTWVSGTCDSTHEPGRRHCPDGRSASTTPSSSSPWPRPRSAAAAWWASATQCSIEPPRYLVCVSKVNHTWKLAKTADGLALAPPRRRSSPTTWRPCSGRRLGDKTDKFDRVSWTDGVTGSPILSECAAWLEGTIIDRVDVGDHVACVVIPVAGGYGTHPR